MSKLAARLYDRFFADKKPVRRHYAAARLNRQNADWGTLPMGANWERRMSLQALRARARQASRDNGHIKKFLSLTRANIIGAKGIQLQSRARVSPDGPLNVPLNKMVEEAWWEWGHKETCSVSQKLNWLGVQNLIVTQLATDGEFLVQMIDADNDFGFALKVWDVNWLDETYNVTNSATGNRIIMSVEYDASDKPVAYWLRTPPSEMNFQIQRQVYRFRIPAEKMIHGFLIHDDESQARGVTWFHAALLDIKNFQGYNEGVIQSARFASNIPLFIKQDPGDGTPYTGGEDDEGRPQLPSMDVSPLAVNLLDPGQEPWQFDPKQPTQHHAEFSKRVLMDVATALDIPYFLLAGDMEAVNFSSSRVGLDDARDIWKGLQDFVADTLCRPIFHAWARAALTTGKLKISLSDFVEIQNPVWRTRGWKYIDPLKDVNAAVVALENNLSTWTDVLGEQGIDLIDMLERRKAEIELAATYGIDLTAVTTVKVADAGTAPANDTGGEPPPEPPPDAKKRGFTNGHAELLS